jgi:DNA-directed RNA polymerase subunit omega
MPHLSTNRRLTLSGQSPVAEGITNPPIDDLLTHSDSKYKLVLFAAKRARQINAYYSQLGEGLLDHVGPLVETSVQEKPLSIALREVNAGKLLCTDVDPDADESADGAGAYDPSA